MVKFATNASGAIWWPNLQLMQVVPSGGQIFIECKSCHLVAKFATNASVAMLLPNLVQVTESISGSVVPLAMFFFILQIDDLFEEVETEIVQLLKFLLAPLPSSRKWIRRGRRIPAVILGPRAPLLVPLIPAPSLPSFLLILHPPKWSLKLTMNTKERNI